MRGLSELRRVGRIVPIDPAWIDGNEIDPERDAAALTWVSDTQLLMFLERLPLVQRQLQRRALAFLRTRLAAAGRDAVGSSDRLPMVVRDRSDEGVVASSRRRSLSAEAC
jgi:hypothetical protein